MENISLAYLHHLYHSIAIDESIEMNNVASQEAWRKYIIFLPECFCFQRFARKNEENAEPLSYAVKGAKWLPIEMR